MENSKKICLCVTSTSDLNQIPEFPGMNLPCTLSSLSSNSAVYQDSSGTTKTSWQPKHGKISSIKARECTFQIPSFRFNIFEYIYMLYIDMFKNRNINIILNHHLPKFQGYQPLLFISNKSQLMWLCKVPTGPNSSLMAEGKQSTPSLGEPEASAMVETS